MSATAVIDTSVFVAILLGEPDATQHSETIRRYRRRVMTAATYLECAMVSGKKTTGRADLDDWLLREAIAIVPVGHALAHVAADAFARYGKGRTPPD